MFGFIKRAIIRHRLEVHAEAERRLCDLTQRVGQQVATLYGHRGTGYDVLGEVELLCRRLDKGQGKL